MEFLRCVGFAQIYGERHHMHAKTLLELGFYHVKPFLAAGGDRQVMSVRCEQRRQFASDAAGRSRDECVSQANSFVFGPISPMNGGFAGLPDAISTIDGGCFSI